MSLFYVSYAAPGGWLGAAFVNAENRVLAMKRAGELKIDPKGDDVQAIVFQFDSLEDVPTVPEGLQDRLLGKAELLKLWPDAEELLDYESHVG